MFHHAPPPAISFPAPVETPPAQPIALRVQSFPKATVLYHARTQQTATPRLRHGNLDGLSGWSYVDISSWNGSLNIVLEGALIKPLEPTLST